MEQMLGGSGKLLETTRDGVVMVVVVLKTAVRDWGLAVSKRQAALSRRHRR
jgi:hypothetical protein